MRWFADPVRGLVGRGGTHAEAARLAEEGIPFALERDDVTLEHLVPVGETIAASARAHVSGSPTFAHPRRVEHQVGAHVGGEPPADHRSREGVDDEGEVADPAGARPRPPSPSGRRSPARGSGGRHPRGSADRPAPKRSWPSSMKALVGHGLPHPPAESLVVSGEVAGEVGGRGRTPSGRRGRAALWSISSFVAWVDGSLPSGGSWLLVPRQTRPAHTSWSHRAA